MIKAVYFDIDGTLIPFGKDVMPKSTLDALHLLHNKGIKVFICTGRVPYFKHSGIEVFDFDGYITSNGQYIYLKDGTVIKEHYLPKSSLESLAPYVKKQQIALSVVSIIMPFRNNNQYDHHLPIKLFEDHLDEPILQLMAYIRPEEDETFLAHLPSCKTARWCETFADIIPSDGGKETGIDAMNAYFGYQMDEVMCFGDGGNDITMFQAVPLSIAMGNASDEVKSYASYVTDDCDQDGIFDALNYFKII